MFYVNNEWTVEITTSLVSNCQWNLTPNNRNKTTEMRKITSTDNLRTPIFKNRKKVTTPIIQVVA